jgi:hypothetical protein
MSTPLPDRDHKISLDEAVRLVTARRDADAGDPNAERPFAFHRLGLDAVLAQSGCVGIRAYPAQHDDRSHTWVLVGVDKEGSDMTGGALLQDPLICPPFCSDGVLAGNG